ncbi:uncharacterized protein LOC119662660 [Teleopsis dalmanni]|uniref:uncharacterized protein LOC119662660 n=1 Tax=Teleopsis dalmanni TaxID=139649 RepID=UPI0018CD0C65|nr:uncharacterized protein LOC119662660 [Teleopsis dalmanni]
MTPYETCEPVCENCPVHGRCIAPEKWECESGYYLEELKCVAHCSSGCVHGGICLQPEACKCELGSTWNNETKVCEATAVTCGDATCANVQTGNHLGTATLTTPATTTTATPATPTTPTTPATPTTVTMTKLRDQVIDANANGVENQGIDYEINSTEYKEIYLSTPHTMHTGSYESTTEKPLKSTNACPVGYIYYHGECRPEIFASAEADCKFKPCAKYAICQEDGTCACQQGFVAQKPKKLQLNNFEYNGTTENVEYMSSTSTESAINSDEFSTTTESIEPAELVCISLTQLNEDSQNVKTAKTHQADNKWINLFFIILGSGCLLCAALYLTVKLMRTKRGKMDVEGRNNLQCTYDNAGLTPTHTLLCE